MNINERNDYYYLYLDPGEHYVRTPKDIAKRKEMELYNPTKQKWELEAEWPITDKARFVRRLEETADSITYEQFQYANPTQPQKKLDDSQVNPPQPQRKLDDNNENGDDALVQHIYDQHPGLM